MEENKKSEANLLDNMNCNSYYSYTNIWKIITSERFNKMKKKEK